MHIYKTTNIVNNKIYVGKQVKNIESYLGSGILLQLAIIKYGKENFKKEILEICNNKKDLSIREIWWINYLDSRNLEKGYNISKGGDGGWGCNNNRTFEERSILSKKAMKTMGISGLSLRSQKINVNLGEEGRKERSKKGRETLGKDGMSNKAKKTIATLGNDWLNKTAIEKLGKKGLSNRSKKAMETLGSEGKKLKAQKANHTRYHTHRNLVNDNCVFCQKDQ